VVVDMPHPGTPAGVRVIANPVRLSATPPEYRLPRRCSASTPTRCGYGSAKLTRLRAHKADILLAPIDERPLGAILKAGTRANSETYSKIPYSTEQGIFAKEQGICTREQGI
jgi:hypothetical protein